VDDWAGSRVVDGEHAFPFDPLRELSVSDHDVAFAACVGAFEPEVLTLRR